jgi:hypothetical protein
MYYKQGITESHLQSSPNTLQLECHIGFCRAHLLEPHLNELRLSSLILFERGSSHPDKPHYYKLQNTSSLPTLKFFTKFQHNPQ